MYKLDAAASPIQYLSTPDVAALTYPDANWSEYNVVGINGARTGSNPQYLLSNGGFVAGTLHLVQFSAADSTTANQNKIGIYLGASLAIASVNTTTFNQTYVFVKVRSGGTLTLYRCPVLSSAPIDGSAVTVEGSAAITGSQDGSGLFIGSRGDLLASRLSNQSHGRVGRTNEVLTTFDIARIAYGMRLADIGRSSVFEVSLKDGTELTSAGANALPFSVNGSPTVVADPAYGYNGDNPPQPIDTVSVAVDAAERVTQRIGTTGTIYPICTYTNSTPSSIERQLYALDGSTVTHAWAAVAGATFSNGTVSFTQGVSIPVGLKRRMAVRTKNSSGVVLATSSISSPFGVGALDAMAGSSSSEKLFDSTSGTGFTANPNASKFNENGWALMGTVGAGIVWANSLITQSGMCRGLLDYGVGGTTLAQWLDLNGDPWKAFAAGVLAAGGKLESLYLSVGSNDAATAGLVTSRAQHAANLRLFIQRVRDLTGQPQLPVLLSGFNRRGRFLTGQTADAFAIAADNVRMAENDVGGDAFVTLVQTLQFELRTDDLVHLTPNAAGFPACVTLSASVFGRRQYGDGAYVRGPTVGTATFNGSTIEIPLTYRAGNDVSPTSGITGFAARDQTGDLTLTVSRKNATALTLAADRKIFSPLSLSLFSGGSPDISAAPFDNSNPPMLMAVNTQIPTSDTNPVADTTAPVMTGAVSITNITETGATLSWPAATDDIAVTGYEYSTNGGANYIDLGALRTVTLSGLVQNTTYPIRVRAYDAAGNKAAALSATLVTSATPADTTAPVLTGSITATNVTSNSATISWPLATDNIAVTGYEYSINGGTSYINSGTARTAALASLNASTTYPIRVRAYDAAGNKSAILTGSFMTLAATVTPVGFVPSVSRTVRILVAKNSYEVGSFWTANSSNSPVGSKDPNSTIDIHFDWSAWLADIGNAQLSSVDFILSPGLISTAGIPTLTGGTVFVSGGTIGQTFSVTCRITTATTPPRIEDRTVVLQIKEQ